MDPEQLTPEQQKKLEELRKKNEAPSKEEKRVAILEKLEFLELTNEEKAKLGEHINESLKVDHLYWSQIFLSSLIATFGLLQNSVAVIIGAMLIAPLLQPIQTMAFGIASGRSRFFYKSSYTLIKSIIFSIFVGVICAWVIPLDNQTSEILARTAPNLLDLFIAIFSAILAFLSLTNEKLSESIAGVAMAASLMPPLAVVGIEIAFGEFTLAWSGLLLFLTNLLAILLVGTVFFIAYGYLPHQEFTQDKAFKTASVLLISTLCICFPLGSSLLRIAEKETLNVEIKAFAEQFIEKNIPSAKLSRVDLTRFDDKEIELLGEIKIPEDTPFFGEIQSQLIEEFEAHFEKKLVLDLELVRIAQIISRHEINESDEILKSQIRIEFANFLPKGNIIQLELQKPEISPLKPEKTLAKIVFVPPVGLSNNDLSNLQSSVEIAVNHDLQWLWMPIAQQKAERTKRETPEEVFQSQQVAVIQDLIQNALPPTITIEDINLSWKLGNNPKASEEADFNPEQISRMVVAIVLSGPPEVRSEIQSLVQKELTNSLEKPSDIKIQYKPAYTFQSYLEGIETDIEE